MVLSGFQGQVENYVCVPRVEVLVEKVDCYEDKEQVAEIGSNAEVPI